MFDMYTVHLYDVHEFESGPLRAVTDTHPNPYKKKKLGLMFYDVGGKVIHSFVGLKLYKT